MLFTIIGAIVWFQVFFHIGYAIAAMCDLKERWQEAFEPVENAVRDIEVLFAYFPRKARA